jgi:microcystin-dependent protein
MADPAWVDGSTPLNSVNMTKLQTRDEKAAANGYASLDATAKVPVAQLPSTVPPGSGFDYFGTALPAGYLWCDGSAVSRTTYAALFNAIGTSCGAGDGSTTFNLPDCRSRVGVGVGSHAEVASVGLTDGLPLASRRARHGHPTGTLTANHNLSAVPSLSASHSLSLPAHAHAVGDPGHVHSINYTSISSGAGVTPGIPVMYYDGGVTNVGGAGTGVSVGNPTSYPGINGGVSISGGVTINGGVTLAGTIGPAGAPADSGCYYVCNKIIKT